MRKSGECKNYLSNRLSSYNADLGIASLSRLPFLCYILVIHAAVQVANFHSLNVVIASVSGIGGFLSGALNTSGTIRGIEKKGEYHPSRNRLVLLLGVGLVVGAELVYVIESGAISFSILSQFMSMYAGIPGVYLGGAVTFRRWELKNGKEIQWEGAWVGTFYAIPKELTWQERYQYRYEQRERSRPRNLAEEAATNTP